MTFIRTTAINKLLALKNRKKVIQGGTWAGKTYGIIPIIINYCCVNPGEQFTIVAETVPALKKGAIKDFLEIMQLTDRWIEDNYSLSNKKYTFSNGSYIEFSSFQTVGDAKAAGKRTGLFINEGQYNSFEVADALMTRTSGPIWVDFNPTKRFWVHKELVDEGDADFIILTYKDNEGLPQSILDDLHKKKQKAFHNTELESSELYQDTNIKSKYWSNWCKVYLDGMVGNLDGVIFQEGVNWEIINELPEKAELVGAGLDFGYSNDPSAFIIGNKYNNKFIFDEEVYQKGLLNSQLHKKIDGSYFETNHLIVGDSAEPKSIDELELYGLNIIGAKKGKDSINFGIGLLQEEKFFVTSRSVNLINELRNYSWKTDKNNKTLNVPVDNYNHAIDSMRYFATEFMKEQEEFYVS